MKINEMWLKDGESCGHPGCLQHVTHPCEGCGRIQGRYEFPEEPLYLPGLGRVCPYCKTWSRYEQPKGKKCFTVSCHSCHKEFEIVKGVRPR